jgi:endonuclease-8
VGRADIKVLGGKRNTAMEGPSVHRVADELQQLEGQCVQSVGGNARQPLNLLAGKKILDVRAVKKRLLIEVEGATAVIHFLMYGTYRLNEERDMDERLRLVCENDTLNVYHASVKVFTSGDEELEQYDTSEEDVLAEEFGREQAVNALMERDDPVADVLLDQQVFGGVGNIVKNEALWEEGIRPTRTSSSLTQEEAEALAEAAVTWTEEWYEAKVKGEEKEWGIYRAQECPRCGAEVEQADIGTYDRRCYWCPACQEKD